MQKVNEYNIVVDEFGNVDVAYYEAKAAEMRSEAIAKWAANMKATIANAVRQALHAPKTRNA